MERADEAIQRLSTVIGEKKLSLAKGSRVSRLSKIVHDAGESSPVGKLGILPTKQVTKRVSRPKGGLTNERVAWLKFRAKVLTNSQQKSNNFTDFMKREKEEERRQIEEEH